MQKKKMQSKNRIWTCQFCILCLEYCKSLSNKKNAKPFKSFIILALVITMFDYDFNNHLSEMHVYCASLKRFFFISVLRVHVYSKTVRL